MGGWRSLPKRLGGGYCRLQMPSRLALGVRGTVAGHRLGAAVGAAAVVSLPREWRVRLRGGGGVQAMKLATPAHQKALEKSLGIKAQGCPVRRSSH